LPVAAKPCKYKRSFSNPNEELSFQALSVVSALVCGANSGNIEKHKKPITIAANILFIILFLLSYLDCVKYTVLLKRLYAL
jgi:hypothetical protein